MSKTSKYIKYVKAWESDPDLKDWIGPMVGDIKSAYCRVCRRPLHPHKKDLMLHGKTKKHLRNLEQYKKVWTSCQPLKNAELGDGTYNISPLEIKTEPKDSFMKSSDLSYARTIPKKNVTIAVSSESPESQEVIHEIEAVKYSEEEIKDTASIVISDDPSLHSTNPFFEWKNIPEFRGWLEVDGDRLSCNVCCRILKPNKTDILKHASGKVHQQKCAKRGIPLLNSCDEVGLSLIYNREEIGTACPKLVDLRSDTITQPNEGMKMAMMNADLGDDFFGDDPTVKALEEKVAALLDKEQGLLLPSGTMANLVAVMTHCWSRDSEVIVGDQSHLYQWSQGGLARVGGIHTKPMKNEPDGTFSLEELKQLLDANRNAQWVIQSLICIENSHNRTGGQALSLKWINDLGSICIERGILLHMDGARLLNASIATGLTPAEIVQQCNSATFCLNKGLGAPMGSVLVGTREFIDSAKRVRTLLGGTMHQAGIFAAAAIYALENVAPKLHWDHANARAIAESVRDLHSSAVTVDLSSVQTNFAHLYTDNIRVNAKDLCDRLSTVKQREFHEIGEEVKVLMFPLTESVVRFATHYDLSKNDVQLAIRKLKLVIEEYDNMLELNFDREKERNW